MSRNLGAIGACVVFAAVAVVAAGGRGPLPALPPAPLNKATLAQIRKLQEERRDVLRDAVRMHQVRIRAGAGTPAGVFEPARRLLQAELELAETRANRLAAHQRYFATLKKLEDMGWVSRLKPSPPKTVTVRGFLPRWRVGLPDWRRTCETNL